MIPGPNLKVMLPHIGSCDHLSGPRDLRLTRRTTSEESISPAERQGDHLAERAERDRQSRGTFRRPTPQPGIVLGIDRCVAAAVIGAQR
jgi:hypothetical protein